MAFNFYTTDSQINFEKHKKYMNHNKIRSKTKLLITEPPKLFFK